MVSYNERIAVWIRKERTGAKCAARHEQLIKCDVVISCTELVSNMHDLFIQNHLYK